MISADTNIFLYALDSQSFFHSQARKFLKAQERNSDFGVTDYVLVEIYNALRNPAIFKNPLSASDAATQCMKYINETPWQYIDYLPGIGKNLWKFAAMAGAARRRIFDARIALTLVENGIVEFATANVKDFKGFGFKRVWNPLEE